MSSLDYFDASQIAARLDYPRLIQALNEAFQNEVQSPVRSHHKLESGTDSPELLVMPAWSGQALAIKLTTVFPDNAASGLPTISGLVLLFDAKSGAPLAVMDAGELTARRTAAASALAASYLSKTDSRHLLMVGTGRLASYLIEAHSTIRDYSQISIWGRSKDKAEQVMASIPDRLKQQCDIACVDDLVVAVNGADVISLATRARSPLVQASWLSPGTHLDLVGGYRPDMREVDDQSIEKASLFVDTREGALAEAGDLIQPIERGVISENHILADLSELCASRHSGRVNDHEITLFKSVGTAVEDLAAASLVVSPR